jgi:hypothetical protein
MLITLKHFEKHNNTCNLDIMQIENLKMLLRKIHRPQIGVSNYLKPIVGDKNNFIWSLCGFSVTIITKCKTLKNHMQ